MIVGITIFVFVIVHDQYTSIIKNMEKYIYYLSNVVEL